MTENDTTRPLNPSELETVAQTPGATASLPAGMWGHWDIREALGAGGYGEVYRAFDPRLERDVALKILRNEGPIQIRRFMEEARIQGSLEHPAIIRIYEVGSIDDAHRHSRPFIAMQLVHGPTFRELATQLSLRERVEVFLQVVEGIHAAHASGLIHRDIKPSNVLVEARPEGGWKAYVSDFGLAVSAQSPSLTQTGLAVGTPHYMPPEQARGTRAVLDVRADIYSLGATLYDILTGRPPFAQYGGMDVILALLSEEPERPRKRLPELPLDLEAIVLKCLEKEPAQRYESARALAQDLEAFLAGRPVAARPLTRLQRGWKWVRRHRLAAALLGAGLTLALGTTGTFLRLQNQAEARARFADRFSLEAERMDGMLRLSALKPIHDTSHVRALVDQRMQWIRTEMTRSKAAQGPGHYALGRAHLSLGEPEEALKHLVAAWLQHGFRTPSCAFAYGLALTRVFPARLQEAERLPAGAARAQALQVLEREVRKPALERLKEGREAALEDGDWVEAHLAFLEERYAACVQRVDQALSKVPFPVDALLLKGEAWLAQANQFRDKGDAPQALKAYQQAREAFQACIDGAPSDPRAYVNLGSLALAAMQVQIYQVGRSPEELHTEAVGALETALRVDPRFFEALEKLAMAHIRMGEFAFIHGGNPRPAFDRALPVIHRSLALRPTERVQQYLLIALLLRGMDECARGMDPQPTFRMGESLAESLMKQGNLRPPTLNTLGSFWANWGRTLSLTHAGDPTHAFRRAEACFQKSAETVATALIPTNNLGLLAALTTDHALSEGRVAEPELNRGMANLEKALSLSPGFPHAISNRSVLLLIKGRWAFMRGQDPEPFLEKMFLDGKSIMGPLGTTSQLWTSLGLGYLLRGEAIAQSGGDPRAALAESLTHLEKSQSLRPVADTIGRNHRIAIAQVHLVHARWLLAQGRSPAGNLNAIRMQVSRALTEGLADASEADVLLGWVALVEGDLPQAKRFMESALKRAPRALAPRLFAARVHLAQKETEMVLNYLDSILKEEPNHHEANSIKQKCLNQKLK